MSLVIRRVDRALRGSLTEEMYARLVEWTTRVHPGYQRLCLERISRTPNCFEVRDRQHSIAIVTAARAPLYRRGIQDRLDYVKHRYTLPGFAEPNDGDHILDIGANIGEFGLAFRKRLSTYSAVEPDPTACYALRRNIGGAEISHEIHATLLWSEVTTLRFSMESESADSAIALGDERGELLEMPALPLDDILAPDISPDFIKMDAEGVEPEVIRGGIRTFGKARMVAIDAGPERAGQPTNVEVSEALERLGFEVRPEGWMVFGRRACCARVGSDDPTQSRT